MGKIKFVVISIFVFLFFAFGASADTLGQNQQFFISSQYEAQSRSVVSATLRHISDRAYFYIADDYWNGIGETVRNQVLIQVESLAKEFDQRIYPIETKFFGSEPNPGIDNDPRVTILLAPLIENAGGYFDTANQYPATEATNSNQREIIYLNAAELSSQSKMFAFLAHEFQHLISFNQKELLRNISDDIWLNELRSEYAVTLLGYNDIYDGSHLQRRVRALLKDSSDSLTEWKNIPTDYGQIGLFGEYIAEHWSPQIIADTLKNKLAGFNSLAESLVKNGHPEAFRDIYRNWLIASFLNDGTLNAKFGYTKPALIDFRVAPTRVIDNLDDNAVFAISDSIKDWQGKWYDISRFQPGSKNVLKINFNSPSLTSFYISYLVFGTDGKYLAYDFTPTPSANAFYIPDIGSNVSRVVLMPIKKDKLAGFSANEPPVTLTTSFERIAPTSSAFPVLNQILVNTPVPKMPDTKYQASNTNLPDGSVIRAYGDYKVYVIKGNWRRHIINPRIFKFYRGLSFEKVIEVDPEVLNQYNESDLVRYAGSQRVYAIDPSGARRWLNMNGEQFSASGRSWDAIFTINLAELNFYKLGPRFLSVRP